MRWGGFVRGAVAAVALNLSLGPAAFAAFPGAVRELDLDPLDVVSPAIEMTVPAFGADEEAASASGEVADLEILLTLHHVAQMQIGQGRLALQKAASARVRSYAKRLVKDHGVASRKIFALIKERATVEVVPDGSDAATGDPSLVNEGLLVAVGEAFDEEYLRLMVEQHAKTVQLLSVAHRVTGAADLRTLLERLQASAQRHKVGAEKLLRRTLNAKS
jgi:putative membrane protein